MGLLIAYRLIQGPSNQQVTTIYRKNKILRFFLDFNLKESYSHCMEILKPENLRYHGVTYVPKTQNWHIDIKHENGRYRKTFSSLRAAIEDHDKNVVILRKNKAITNASLIEKGLKPPITDLFDKKQETIVNLPNEIWKDVVGFEGIYLVSNLGRIQSLARDRILENKILKQYINFSGYVIIKLQNNGKIFSRKVHRLVAIAFKPNPNNYSEINYISGVKTENHVENLEWCDHHHNMKHAVKMGLHRCIQGEDIHLAKLTEEQVLEIREKRKSGVSLNQLALEYKVSKTTTSKICLRQTWKHI